ncbi:MAG TPA: Flp pilus assembly protein CpaB [Gaiellaceae bacterium]|jgi:Flp pilus assembly protein CpaB|nr:Flp pilus assembly protein CpaB [Gaiellaceae bacterium]
MTYRIRNIGIAVALAIVAGLLTTFYVTNYKRNVQQGEENVAVYVASKDIALGTNGGDIANRKLLKVEHVPRRSVVPGAISQPNQIDSLVAVEPIYAGEQISTRRFRAAEEQGVRAQLKGNLRAVQISGTEHQLLAGTLKAGDRVDVVASLELPNSNDRRASRVVLRDILVLQAPNTSRLQSKIGSDPQQPFSAMFQVTDAQAQKFFFVVTDGDWTLQLRPVTDAADSPESIETTESVLGDGLRAGQRRKLRGGR